MESCCYGSNGALAVGQPFFPLLPEGSSLSKGAYMTLAATVSYLGYIAAEGQMVFPLPFRLFAPADLEVYLNGLLTTSYTLAGIDQPTGTLTMLFPLHASDALRLRRVTARQQLIDYRPNDPFGAESHEAALDRIVAMIQDLQEE